MGVSVKALNVKGFWAGYADQLRDPIWVNKMKYQGVLPVKIVGYDKPCVGYFWLEEVQQLDSEHGMVDYWRQCGLVVLEDDYKAREEARKCMELKEYRCDD